MNKPLLILFSGAHGFQRILELLLVILIISILAATMIHTYLPLVSRAKVFNGAIFGLEKYKREIAYHWALYGEWPENEAKIELFHSDPFYKEGTSHIEKADLEKGAIHVFFREDLNGRILSIRPAILKENSSGPVIWVCGAAPARSSTWAMVGIDRTIMDEYFVPKSLR